MQARSLLPPSSQLPSILLQPDAPECGKCGPCPRAWKPSPGGFTLSLFFAEPVQLSRIRIRQVGIFRLD